MFNNVFALEYDGDFSSRSVIMTKMSNQESISQEQKDILILNKLAPTTSCLFAQIKKGEIEKVKILLESKVNPNSSLYGDYPIYIASKKNNFEIVKLLIEHNAKLDRGFFSELYEAVKNKNSQMAIYLIDNGAKVNYIDSITTNSVLYVALKNKMYDVVKKLIEKGVSADIKSIKLIKKKKLQYLFENLNN